MSQCLPAWWYHSGNFLAFPDPPRPAPCDFAAVGRRLESNRKRDGEAQRVCEITEFQMSMRVDETGNDRDVAQVIGSWVRGRMNGDDAAVLNLNDAVFNRIGIDGKNPTGLIAAALGRHE